MASPQPSIVILDDQNPRASFHSQHSHFGPAAEPAGRFPDLAQPFEHLNINNPPPQPTNTYTMPSFDVGGKDFILISYVRDGDDWNNPLLEEIPGPQPELKKIVKKNEGSAVAQLEHMGKNRRKQVNDVAADLTRQEPANVFWEPVFIKDLDKTTRQGKLSVKAFKVIFARRPRRAEPVFKKKLGPKVTIKQAAPPPKAPEPPKVQEEKPKEKPKPARRQSELNDPFSTNWLFNPGGFPMDNRGPIQYQNAGLPAHIGAEVPLGYRPPPREEPPRPAAHPTRPAAQHTLGSLDDILADVDDHIDGIVNVPEDGRRPGLSRPPTRQQDTPQVRRPSSASRPAERFYHRPGGYRHSEYYPSSRSSWASEEDSVIYGEWDDISSRTSEDTHGSYGHSPAKRTYRVPPPPSPRHRKYHRETQDYRYREGEARLQVADSRRQRVIEDQRYEDAPIIDRLPPPRRQNSPPLIHQPILPPSPARQGQVSPLPHLEYPPYATREQEQVVNADDYMQNIRRNEEIRAQEAAAAQGYGGSALTARKRYSYEPRDAHVYYGRS